MFFFFATVRSFECIDVHGNEGGVSVREVLMSHLCHILAKWTCFSLLPSRGYTHPSIIFSQSWAQGATQGDTLLNLGNYDIILSAAMCTFIQLFSFNHSSHIQRLLFKIINTDFRLPAGLFSFSIQFLLFVAFIHCAKNSCFYKSR